MPKLISTVSTVVVRDKKRVTVAAGKAFDFTKEEVDSIKAIMPTALRKPVNEDPEPTDETAPENKAGSTATDDPADGPKKAKRTAAQKDSASGKATKAEAGEPKSTGEAAKQAADDSSDDDSTDEDDDI